LKLKRLASRLSEAAPPGRQDRRLERNKERKRRPCPRSPASTRSSTIGRPQSAGGRRIVERKIAGPSPFALGALSRVLTKSSAEEP
jgi:hypothetical protein